jgi:hypothetical protein
MGIKEISSRKIAMKTQTSSIQNLDVNSHQPGALLKRADLASSVRAGLLGVGLGILLFPLLQPFWVLIVALGGVMHVWGMFTKHRLEKEASRSAVWWSEALYWLCWLILLLGAFLLFPK